MTNYTNEQIQHEVIKIIAERAGKKPEEIGLEQKLIEDLAFDSLDAVESVMKLEEALDITIPEKDAQRMQTVRNTYEIVQKIYKQKYDNAPSGN